ncbi:Isoquinoline 1-oxidoreductase subunit [Variovorax sp. 770b2]|jgi:hypothetical protein|uniref:Isoquinoline 1-oxidoreductase subunit n=1 Tax=Variovorax sp. 770b2 TaxID=1566271 RepID=UPI0008E6AC1D|nr:Isoquinoline 1-oxidoreductase subunit [Variovorax sp. 770b2]SFP91798.1 hypothetical protein SAMN03159339_4606 [Variovorax sp. 770b2]
MKRRPMGLPMLLAALALLALPALQAAPPAPPPETLKAPGEFDAIADPAARSAAIFLEASKVIQSPRCLNCHPSARVPTQGENLHTHVPYLQAGQSGKGLPGLRCTACHQAANVSTQGASIASIPGHPAWHLAPASMAWQGRSLAEICKQIKDPALNGGMNLEKIHKHMADDPLVGWAWHPGEGRKPAPGTQKEFGRLIQAWIATGAACPGGAERVSR